MLPNYTVYEEIEYWSTVSMYGKELLLSHPPLLELIPIKANDDNYTHCSNAPVLQ